MKKLLQIIGIILSLMALVGFSLCGMMGIGAGMRQSGALDGRLLFIGFGLTGIGIAIACGFAIRAIYKSMRTEADNDHMSIS